MTFFPLRSHPPWLRFVEAVAAFLPVLAVLQLVMLPILVITAEPATVVRGISIVGAIAFLGVLSGYLAATVFIVDTWRDRLLTSEQKVHWTLALVFLLPPALPIYWFVRIRPQENRNGR